MLSIKAPLETVLKPDFLHTNESFCERIAGNYRQMGQFVSREDLIHVITQPPEVFLLGGDSPQVIGQSNIRNTQIQKVEVLNQLINRILIAADGHLTYQDEVYITNALHKFGVRNHQTFMRQVYALTQDTKNTNRLLASYQTNMNRLSKLVNQFAIEHHGEQKTEIAKVENEILHLHEEVNRRWQAGDLYQMQQSFRQSSEGRTTISRETFQMAEQIRLSQQLRLQELREEARGEFVPLIYHHENLFESVQEEDLPVSKERMEQKIVSAVLLSLVDNLYQSVYEQVDHALENWYHTEYTFFEAGKNVFSRMEENTSLRQLFYEQSALSLMRQNANRTELAMIEELMQLTEENTYSLQETNEGDLFSSAEISYLSQTEETTETTENLLEKNTYEQQVYQQNIQNERRQKEYLSNLQKIVEGFREPTGEDARERTKRETLFALEHPEAFQRQYAKEVKEERERRDAAMEETLQTMSEPQRQLATLMREFIASPVPYLEGHMVREEDLLLLHYDSLSEQEKTFVLENESESRRDYETVLRQVQERTGIRDGEVGAQETVASKEEPVPQQKEETLVFRQEDRIREEIAGQEETETQTLVERQRRYNRILREVVSRLSEGAIQQETVEDHPEAPVKETLLLSHRQEVEQRLSESERELVRTSDVRRVIEEIRQEPAVRRVESETKAPESLHLVHHSAQNTVDEETIEELKETLRRQEKTTSLSTEARERIENIERRIVREENRKVITTQSEEEIAQMVGRSLRGQIDEITGKVYGRIERQLNSERRRRGL
ncbi:MAG: hypothetical protein IJ679_11050 [Lachnospiraceae bacterium]|nr:hypothetical protein [Lachnospiraceae bacterium]